MEVFKKILINEREYDIPEGIESLGKDNLYLVDWNLLEIAKEISTSESFEFFNPRHLGQYEIDKDSAHAEVFLGQGFDKESMKELMTDISNNGIECPLMGYFVVNKDQVKVRINNGERRWRCLDRMVERNDKVWSVQHNQFMPAKEVYAKVICCVKSMTEEEAFQRAYAVTETSINWGDGANARMVKTLYEKGKTDEEICKLLNKGKNWLAETYSLNDLDEYCFGFLLSGRINRKVALDLVKIKDIKTRQLWLAGAWKDALENHEKLQTKNEKALEKAEAHEELAEAQVEEAKLKGGTSELIGVLEGAVTEAAEKTKKRKQIKAASARPVVKSVNLRRSAGGVLNVALRPLKIKKKLEVVEKMIAENDNSIVSMEILNVLKHAYKCILEGEEDIMVVLKKLAE